MDISHEIIEINLEVNYQQKGDQGFSAYEVSVQNGFEGTEQEWLDSLKGKDGVSPVIATIAPTDPAPTLDGAYIPTVTQNESGTPIVYTNAGGLTVNTADGGEDYGMGVQLIKNGTVWVKNSYPLPMQDVSGLVEKAELDEQSSDLFRKSYNNLFPQADLPVRRYTAEGVFNDYTAGYSQTAVSEGLSVAIPSVGTGNIRYYLRTGIISLERTKAEAFFNILNIISPSAVGVGYIDSGGIYVGYIYNHSGQLSKVTGFGIQSLATVEGYVDGDNIKMVIDKGLLYVYKNNVVIHSLKLSDSDFNGELLICQRGFINYVTSITLSQDPIRDYVKEEISPLSDQLTDIEKVIVDGTNLIDKTQLFYGYYNSLGVLMPSVNTVTTPLIEIDASKSYLSLNKNSLIGSTERLLFFDESKSFLSGVDQTVYPDGQNIPIPTLSKFVSVNIVSISGGVGDPTNNQYVNDLQLEYGDHSTPFESFGKKITPNALPSNIGVVPDVSIDVSSASSFVVNSRHPSGEIVSHTWELKDTSYEYGWTAPSIIHRGNTIIQGSFNWIHMLLFPNENMHVGIGHGCEFAERFDFYIDGVKFIPSEHIGETLSGAVFSFDSASNIYAVDASIGGSISYPQEPRILSTKHYMQGEIRGGSKTRNYNKLVIMRDGTKFNRCYLGMHLCRPPYFNRIQLHNIENTVNLSPEFTPILPSTASIATGGVFDTAEGFRAELATGATSYSDDYDYVFTTRCFAGKPEEQEKMNVSAAGTTKLYFSPVITPVTATPRGLVVDEFNIGDILEGVVERELIL